MSTMSYDERRGELETYFDRTAVEAWARLTSTAPVSRIRATVRSGRDQMRAALLDALPVALAGRRVLDAGCGTGALSVEAARRGASVVAIDLSPRLVQLARERLPAEVGSGRIDFKVGDMLDAGLGSFDHVVAMDSLIHYRRGDVLNVLADLAARTRRSMVFTFAPLTPMLALMWSTGRLFPRSDRAPAIEPLSERGLVHAIEHDARLADWRVVSTRRIDTGFYKSQALELVRA